MVGLEPFHACLPTHSPDFFEPVEFYLQPTDLAVEPLLVLRCLLSLICLSPSRGRQLNSCLKFGDHIWSMISPCVFFSAKNMLLCSATARARALASSGRAVTDLALDGAASGVSAGHSHRCRKPGARPVGARRTFSQWSDSGASLDRVARGR